MNCFPKILFTVCSLIILSGCGKSDEPKKLPVKPPEEIPAGEYDVFLLIGQSNMAGRGKLLTGDDAVIEGVYLLNDRNEAVPARNPLNQYSTIRKELDLQGMNPGYSFSKKIRAETGRKILLVVNARGGSSIGEWAKGGSFYNDAVRRTKEAMKLGDLKAILWHQGESNSGSPDNYLTHLSPIVAGLRTEFGKPALPFVAGEIARWHANESKFNPVIRRIGQSIPNSDYVSSEGAGPLIDHSDPHFNRDGQILLGERYAEKVLKMAYKK